MQQFREYFHFFHEQPQASFFWQCCIVDEPKLKLARYPDKGNINFQSTVNMYSPIYKNVGMYIINKYKMQLFEIL